MKPLNSSPQATETEAQQHTDDAKEQRPGIIMLAIAVVYIYIRFNYRMLKNLVFLTAIPLNFLICCALAVRYIAWNPDRAMDLEDEHMDVYIKTGLKKVEKISAIVSAVCTVEICFHPLREAIIKFFLTH